MERADTTDPEPIDEDDLVKAADQWRYERNLLAAGEVERWLERFGLTVDVWFDWLRTTQFRTRWSGQLAADVAEHPAHEGAVAPAAWSQAVCSGTIERLAREFAAAGLVDQLERTQDGVVPAARDAQHAGPERPAPATPSSAIGPSGRTATASGWPDASTNPAGPRPASMLRSLPVVGALAAD